MSAMRPGWTPHRLPDGSYVYISAGERIAAWWSECWLRRMFRKGSKDSND